MVGEDEVEKLPRHKAAADDGQANALRHGALPFDFERMRNRRRVVARLWKPPAQSLRHRREIGPAYSAESFSLSLIRSAFWTEHRVCFEKRRQEASTAFYFSATSPRADALASFYWVRRAGAQ